MVRALLRIAAISCVIAIVVLSWLPKDMEIRTGMRGQFEHVAAYVIAAAILKLGWPLGRTRWMGLGFAALAAVLETGQIWIPGRTSQLIDVVASTAGAAIGLVGGHAALHRLRRRG